jgi:hypothetical protein
MSYYAQFELEAAEGKGAESQQAPYQGRPSIFVVVDRVHAHAGSRTAWAPSVMTLSATALQLTKSV